MKKRDARDLNLRAIHQHLHGVEGIPLTPRIRLESSTPAQNTRDAALYPEAQNPFP